VDIHIKHARNRADRSASEGWCDPADERLTATEGQGRSLPVSSTSGQAEPNGRSRLIFLVAASSGEGLLTEPTAAIQPWRRELVFMPPLADLAGRCLLIPVGREPTFALGLCAS
jgi:hypothetical protein